MDLRDHLQEKELLSLIWPLRHKLQEFRQKYITHISKEAYT